MDVHSKASIVLFAYTGLAGIPVTVLEYLAPKNGGFGCENQLKLGIDKSPLMQVDDLFQVNQR